MTKSKLKLLQQCTRKDLEATLNQLPDLIKYRRKYYDNLKLPFSLVEKILTGEIDQIRRENKF